MGDLYRAWRLEQLAFLWLGYVLDFAIVVFYERHGNGMVVLWGALDAEPVTVEPCHVHAYADFHVLVECRAETLSCTLAWRCNELDALALLAFLDWSDQHSCAFLLLNISGVSLGTILCCAEIPCRLCEINMPIVEACVFSLAGVESEDAVAYGSLATEHIEFLDVEDMLFVVELCRLSVQCDVSCRADAWVVVVAPTEFYWVVRVETSVDEGDGRCGFSEILCAMSLDIDVAIVECGTFSCSIERFAAIEDKLALLVKRVASKGVVGAFEMAVVELGMACASEVAKVETADETAVAGCDVLRSGTMGKLCLYDCCVAFSAVECWVQVVNKVNIAVVAVSDFFGVKTFSSEEDHGEVAYCALSLSAIYCKNRMRSVAVGADDAQFLAVDPYGVRSTLAVGVHSYVRVVGVIEPIYSRRNGEGDVFSFAIAESVEYFLHIALLVELQFKVLCVSGQ